MDQFISPETTLRKLTEPRRNRYFYGKMLDVPQLRLEQDYGKKKQWLMNRLSLGTGVLCGLGVVIDKGKLCVNPGVAIDPFGREIIVPGRFCIDPYAPKPPCERGWKGPADNPAAPPRGPATLWVCYNECLTDMVPAEVSDCHGEPRCEAGTIVETFKFRITEGATEGPRFDSAFCIPIHEIFKKKEPPTPGEPPADDPHTALCKLLENDCCVGDVPTCVPIATFSWLDDNQIGDLEVCAARNRLYSNQVLLELILCLMARIEECCDHETEEMLRIVGIDVRSAAGSPTKPLTNTDLLNGTTGMLLPANFQAAGMTVRFNKAVKPDTVKLAAVLADFESSSFIFQQVRLQGGMQTTIDVISGPLAFSAGDSAFELTFGQGPLKPGTYFVQLYGDPDAAHGRPAIADAAQSLRLDGEADALPSGRGDEGGVFGFYITVEGRPVQDTLRIVGVEGVLGTGNPPPQLQSPAEGLTMRNVIEPLGLRVRFNRPVDRESLVLAQRNADLGLASFLVATTRDGQTPVAAVPGTLSFDDDQTAVFRTARGTFPRGTYTVALFGDSDANHPAITTSDRSARLDGEPAALPSGDGAQGGTFRFPLVVTE
jgi:hypothetical protein